MRLVESLRIASGGRTERSPGGGRLASRTSADGSEHHRLLQGRDRMAARRALRPLRLELERASTEGMNLVSTSSTTTQTRQRLTLEDSYATLMTLSEQASVAFDLSSLEEPWRRASPRREFAPRSVLRARRQNATILVPVVCLVDGQAVKDCPSPAPRKPVCWLPARWSRTTTPPFGVPHGVRIPATRRGRLDYAGRGPKAMRSSATRSRRS